MCACDRYAGGPKSTTKTTTERREESYSKQSSIVEQVNGYHPEEQIVPASSTDKAKSQAVIKELESIMTEEETIIEESKEYRLHFNPDYDKGRRGGSKGSRSSVSPDKGAAAANHRSNLTVTTAYTTLNGYGQESDVDGLVRREMLPVISMFCANCIMFYFSGLLLKST